MARRKIVFVVFDGVQALDVVGPMDVFDSAGRVSAGEVDRQQEYALEVVAPRAGHVRAFSGLGLHAERALEAVKGPIDTLLVAGGRGTRALAQDQPSLRALRRLAKRARRLASVCTGAYVLAAAGLLDGKRATTHWAHCSALAQRHPQVELVPDAIFVRDGDTWTSAGVTAGIDLALALVEQDLGREVALTVARHLVLYARRAGGQAQFSVQLATQEAERDAISELQAWIPAHLSEGLSVASLAKRARMSERNFARVFRAEVGVTPAHYVERARVQEARRHLETSARSIDEIASSIGFGGAQTMRRAFARALGVSPRVNRERFAMRVAPVSKGD